MNENELERIRAKRSSTKSLKTKLNCGTLCFYSVRHCLTIISKKSAEWESRQLISQT